MINVDIFPPSSSHFEVTVVLNIIVSFCCESLGTQHQPARSKIQINKFIHQVSMSQFQGHSFKVTVLYINVDIRQRTR